jgi:glycosyltransferase involved in cell wall biosynthesis
MNPKVSIIVPCYNAENWIDQCLNSALNQTYDNLEIIVVDNESTDGTIEKIEESRERSNSFVLSTAENIYPNCWDEARAKGYKLATGDYLTTLASDDYLSENYIENCVRYIMMAPDKIMAFQSPVRGVKEGNVYTGEISYSYKSIKEFKQSLMTRCCVNSPTVIYNRKLYEDGLLKTKPEKYGGAADYDLYCKLVDSGVFVYPSNKWLGYHYRWHPEQATWNVQREGINYDAMIQSYWNEKWNH